MKSEKCSNNWGISKIKNKFCFWTFTRYSVEKV
nr:MAG TPA: hypothetical protein [Caudoviricetes sp.]